MDIVRIGILVGLWALEAKNIKEMLVFFSIGSYLKFKLHES